jgi:hypothetical protein
MPKWISKNENDFVWSKNSSVLKYQHLNICCLGKGFCELLHIRSTIYRLMLIGHGDDYGLGANTGLYQRDTGYQLNEIV